MEITSKYLLLHSGIVLLTGLLCGYPYGVAILKKKDEEIIRAWKLAHGSLSLGGTLSIAIAAGLHLLHTHEVLAWIIAMSFIVSGYSFCIALVLEPVFRVRGLKWSVKLENNIVFVGNSIGALTSLVGTIAFIIAAYLSI